MRRCSPRGGDLPSQRAFHRAAHSWGVGISSSSSQAVEGRAHLHSAARFACVCCHSELLGLSVQGVQSSFICCLVCTAHA